MPRLKGIPYVIESEFRKLLNPGKGADVVLNPDQRIKVLNSVIKWMAVKYKIDEGSLGKEFATDEGDEPDEPENLEEPEGEQ